MRRTALASHILVSRISEVMLAQHYISEVKVCGLNVSSVWAAAFYICVMKLADKCSLISPSCSFCYSF